MSTSRAVALIVLLSLLSAGLLALTSRTPAAVRLAVAERDATDPLLGAGFSDAQVARHGAYRRPAYTGLALSLILEIGTLLLLAAGPFRSLVARMEAAPGGWWGRVALLGVALGIILMLVALPLSFVRGHVIEHAWGLSTQSALAWLGDQARGLLIGAVVSAVSAVAFFGVLRAAPRLWWLWGWAVFTVLTIVMTFVWPVVVAPLFNTFTPLEDGSLKNRVAVLARESGVRVDEVLVADASKRSTAENAYVAGLGGTQRLVLYDTLIEAGDDDETAFVVAHELGHKSGEHIIKGLALAAVGLLLGFALLKLLADHSGWWGWAGARGITDPRSIPLLVLFATLATLATLPVQNTVSRHFERQADRVALELTGDPDTATRVFRRLAFSNLADLRPPRAAVWLLYSHPPVSERIKSATAD